MRQIVLDTETTGLSHAAGHRLIEIGCFELQDRQLTGNSYHTYLNPERSVDDGAFKIHGISNDFLNDQPFFRDVAHEFLQFIANAELIIHNAPFDLGFLDAELKLANISLLLSELCIVCDTLVLAKSKHPGQRNSLDALCKRYEIDNSNRTLHGALLDAKILAHVYLAMTGGQALLFADDLELPELTNFKADVFSSVNTDDNSVVILADGEELERHQQFMKFMSNYKTE